ncbi:MAG: stage V sporulation protein B [Clostridia bacterium]
MVFDKKSLIYNTLVLTAANFIVRMIGFAYRILLSRLIGAEGIGLFQLVAPIHMLTITLVTSGLPIAVSRMVSRHVALKDDTGAKQVVQRALTAVSILSVFIMLLLSLNLKTIAFHLLKQPRTYLSLVAFIPCILILGLSSVYNGYFYGKKNVHPPALSEMVEQILRVGLVLATLHFFAPLEAEHASAIAMAGMVVGEMAGLILVQYFYWKEKKHNSLPYRPAKHSPNILRELFAIAAPITGTRLTSSIMQSINSIIIPQRLILAGLSNSEALSQFGMLTGMAMPFIFLPFTLTGALSVVMVPNLSEDRTLNDWRSIQEKIGKAVLITCITTFPIAALLMPLSTPLSVLLYNEKEVGRILFYLAPIIIPFCLQHTLSGLLNGLGRQGLAAANYLIGASASLVCNYFMVSDPLFGIYGYVIGLSLSSMITCSLNYMAIKKYGRIKTDLLHWFIKPAFAALCMAVATRWCYSNCVVHQLPLPISIFISTLLGMLVFALLAYGMGVLSSTMFTRKR